MKQRTTRVTIAPDGEPIFSEMAMSVEIDDEGAGEFVVVTTNYRGDEGKIAINPEEWGSLKAVVDDMIKECKE